MIESQTDCQVLETLPHKLNFEWFQVYFPFTPSKAAGRTSTLHVFYCRFSTWRSVTVRGTSETTRYDTVLYGHIFRRKNEKRERTGCSPVVKSQGVKGTYSFVFCSCSVREVTLVTHDQRFRSMGNDQILSAGERRMCHLCR